MFSPEAGRNKIQSSVSAVNIVREVLHLWYLLKSCRIWLLRLDTIHGHGWMGNGNEKQRLSE